MDSVADFLKFAAKTEFTTAGGLFNFVGLGLVALIIAGADQATVLFQLLEFLSRALDRALTFFEKCMEFVVALIRPSSTFKASQKPKPYTAPTTLEPKLKPLIVVGILALGCALAVGAERSRRARSCHRGASEQV